MNSLKIGNIAGIGGLGVLSAGLFISNALKIGYEWIFGLGILLYVTAGAIALVVRNL